MHADPAEGTCQNVITIEEHSSEYIGQILERLLQLFGRSVL